MRSRCARAVPAALVMYLFACGDGPTTPPDDPPDVPAVHTLTIIDPPTELRQGDAAAFEARVRDEDGAAVDVPVSWSLLSAVGGQLTTDGRFVGHRPGVVRVVAYSGPLRDTALVTIKPRGVGGGFSVAGRGAMDAVYTTDLWVFGDHAYTGTVGDRTVDGVTRTGNTLYAWLISDPANPVITDSLILAAGKVNDVKVSADGRFAVATHEPCCGGIALLDLTDPGHPSLITTFSDVDAGLGSVHNAWIDGDYVYAASNQLSIIDVSELSAPRLAGGFPGGDWMHDVYVRDGLAFLSQWNSGLVIVDVGNGIRGGSPQAPEEVSRVLLGGFTHNAWYWPDAGYVFVGNEGGQFPFMHIIDVRDLAAPRPVASYRVQGEQPHNFWVDEERGIIYAAWYTQGLRAVDVSGELMGDLEQQGREIAFSVYDGPGNCPVWSQSPGGTCTWAPQLHRGLVWVADMNAGIVALRPDF